MSIETLGFIVSFVFVTAILLWFVIGSRGKWFIKAIAIASLCLLSYLNWNSINGMLGWATNDSLPNKFEVLWVTVKEPNKQARTEGGIFVLLRNINKEESDGISLYNKDDKQEPRLYKVKYTPKKHEQAMAIIEQIKKGKRVFGSGKKKGKGQGNKQGQPGNMPGNPWGTMGHDEDLFYILPPVVPPQK